LHEKHGSLLEIAFARLYVEYGEDSKTVLHRKKDNLIAGCIAGQIVGYIAG
jgi:hypothetical protein